jgi:predicted amidohydrolase YtcJ
MDDGEQWVIRRASVFSGAAAMPGLHDVWISGERIVAVTPTDASARADLPSLDARGRRLSAGFTDAHAHLDREGLRARLTPLGAPRSRQELLDRIAEAVARALPGEWIVTEPLGTPPDYPDAVLPGSDVLPTLRELDAVSPENPVYIRPIWGYWNPGVPLVSVANSLALALCGVDVETPAPSPRVTIDRDESGLTGVFVERTAQPIVEHALLPALPGFDVVDRMAGVREGIRVYNRHGTTSVFEGHGLAAPSVSAYGLVAGERAASMKATIMLSADWRSESFERVGDVVSEWQRWAASRSRRIGVPGIYVEPVSDGDHAPRRARHPQTGWAGFTAASVQDRDALQALLDEAARARIRVSTIFPGIAEMMESTARRVGDIRDLRWVVSHQQVFTEADLERIARLGIVVTTIAGHQIHRTGEHAARVRDPHARVVPLRSMLDRGIPFALGSDNRPPSLFDSMQHVVLRRGRGGTVVDPDQALTPSEALSAMTQGGAFLVQAEHDRGEVRAGMRADLVIFRDDPLTVAPAELSSVETDAVIVDGSLVIGDGERRPGSRPERFGLLTQVRRGTPRGT